MRKLRALVFDDDGGIRELLMGFLSRRGYEVFGYAEPNHCPEYNRAACACETWQTCGDVVITDLDMPQVSGLELIETQRQRGCKIEPRNVAVMSGCWSDESLGRASRLGCRVFHKPFKVHEMGIWLDECEARCRCERALRALDA